MFTDDLEFEPMPIDQAEKKQIEEFIRLQQQSLEKTVGIPAEFFKSVPDTGFSMRAFERIFNRER